MPNVIRKTYDLNDFLKTYVKSHHMVLNLGSSDSGQLGWTNVDIQAKPGVNLIADAHDLNMIKDEHYDAVICCAMLQYCQSPRKVTEEIHRVLKKGGLLYVDVPFIQQYCLDMPDLWRFTLPGLRLLFKDFEILEAGVSIPASSAILFYLQDLPTHPYIKTGLQYLFWPFKWVTYGKRQELAGGLYLIGRKA